MNVSELLRWQWTGYPTYHGARINLLIHIVAVPLFLAGNVGAVWGVVQGRWPLVLVSLGAMAASVVLQGRGHGREAVPPVPFSSPVEAVSRIFLEQWITFPRFVLSGGWLRALRGTGT